VFGRPEHLEPLYERLRALGVDDPTEADIAMEQIAGAPSAARKRSYRERRNEMLLALLDRDASQLDKAADELGMFFDHCVASASVASSPSTSTPTRSPTRSRSTPPKARRAPGAVRTESRKTPHAFEEEAGQAAEVHAQPRRERARRRQAGAGRPTRQVMEILERLAREGCRAADYALSGAPPWPHLCAVHFDGWRVVVAFPTDDEVAIVKIARHDPSTDPYREIAEDLGIPVSIEPRTKPPCREPDGEPPVDPELVENVQAAFTALTQREQRQRSRR
jgi:hypothetical protein